MPPRLFTVTLFAHLLWTSAASAQAPAAGPYDFSYRVSGDRRVAPVQVFDDGRNTYVQFKAGQTVPAIFTVDEAGEKLASYTAAIPYVVINGTARELVMRIGGVSAAAQYEGAPRRLSQSAGGSADEGLASPAPVPIAMSRPSSLAGGGVAPRSLTTRTSMASLRPIGGALVFDAALADQNMRRVLSRWARMAGWSFEAEHWTVDVDIPLAGAASFSADFKGSVRALLASTELSSRPLQPCFYSNNVMRVVPLAEACDRTVASSATR